MSLYISLFGRFEVLRDNLPVVGFEARKVQELFSYLLLYRNRMHARETLAGTLWGESTSAQARKYLRQALWQLQSALDGESSATSCWLLVDPDWLRLSSGDNMQLDVELFESAYALTRGTPGQQLGEEQVAALALAVEVYKGDLLEGWYQDWCLFERERLQNMYLDMLEKMLNCCEARGEYERGIEYGMRSLRHDYARECTHRRLMRLYYLAGNRTAALRQYERCAEALRKELDVDPSESTKAVWRQIQEDRLTPRRAQQQPVRGSTVLVPPETGTSQLLVDTLRRLQAYQRVLYALQHNLQQDIRSIERALGRSGQS